MAPNPGRYNINVYKGTTFSLAPVWKIGGNPVDLTGYTADMQVRASTDTGIVTELSTANGRAVIVTYLGQTTLTLTATQTAALTSGTYIYDLNLTAPDSTVTKILSGNFTVLDSVTQ
jgi:hypothetical protein